ncbi:reverse transcriptase [Gossypium australe]|uniref:Reverse transcriptase n=1 Tax=Gossypium australe TaxID=47621 RepID=A0A5B6WPR8_9ROSI|nr:reverse transcriptase [Gossypium australe]
MSKAYDRVEWCFIEKVMLKFGFSRGWVNKIMNCIQSHRCYYSGEGPPSRGPLIPLSLPFLYALSRMLMDAQANARMKGIRASREGPRINHIFFADDTLLFVRNNRNEVQECMEILARFESMSGQKANADKSMVCFSPKTPIPFRIAANEIFKMKVVDKLDNYLGLPIPVGRNRAVAFKCIMDRTAMRINSWSKRLLSNAGKEIFIKVVIQSMPTYAFSIFLAPKGVIENIHTMMGRVWWGGKENNRVWSRISWDRLCHPKGIGVLALGISISSILPSREDSAKYFPNGDIFHPKNVDKPFFTWQSIAKAADKLREGFGWNVSNGRSVDIWRDNWGFEGLSGSSIRMDRRLVPEVYVSELFNADRDGWNEVRVSEIYDEYFKDQIYKLPISHAGHADQRVWFHNPCGFFSTKSAYSWLILRQIGFDPHRIFWKMIWKLKTLPKVRVFC